MSQKKETGISKSPDHFHRSLCIPSVEEQLKSLSPSRKLVEFYRNKLASYEKEFTRMTEKVNLCKRTCDGTGEMRTELRRCSDEVFTLQKALSDMQVYLHQERNQVLSMHSENDLLKIQMAKDRNIINFLLHLCGTTEDQVTSLINEGKAECLRKTQAIQVKDGFKFPMTDKKDTGNDMDSEMVLLKMNAVESKLQELTTASQDEIHSLHQDRELLQMEKGKEYQRLQDEISVLTDRLSAAHVNICELTSELITVKTDFFKKEEKWILEKEKERQSKHSCSGVEEVPEKYERKSDIQKDRMLKAFKDHIQHNEKLIKFYKEHCVSLENELWELNSCRDKSTEILQAHVEKMNEQLTNMKDRYEKLLRKQNYEAEGLRSEVKILKGHLHGLERKLACHNYTVNVPLRKELIVNARETKHAAKCLEKELCLIHKKMMGIKLRR